MRINSFGRAELAHGHGNSAATIKEGGAARVLFQQHTTSSKADDNTLEAVLATYTVPAGLVGVNDSIRITHLWQYPNSGTSKNIRITIGGTTMLSFAATTTAKYQSIEIIRNRNSLTSQITYGDQMSFGGPRALAPITLSKDFSLPQEIQLIGSWGTAGAGSNLISLESVIIEHIPGV